MQREVRKGRGQVEASEEARGGAVTGRRLLACPSVLRQPPSGARGRLRPVRGSEWVAGSGDAGGDEAVLRSILLVPHARGVQGSGDV